MTTSDQDMVLDQPALGHDVQLGMLYDVRSSQFFAGVSLWNNDVVNAHQELDEKKVQNATFQYSYSLEEARKNNSLDVEGSLSLDLKIFSAEGSAKYLNYKKSSMYEARVDVMCTVVRRTRRIPQETLSSLKYENYLDDPRYTHFVAEVVEGGSATLSFVQSCSSAEEAKKITGELRISIHNILPVSGKAKVDFSDEEKSKFENVQISYSGAIVENVSNFEDACRVAFEMPTKVAEQRNTLSYKLLPLSVLDSRARRLIRRLDERLVTQTAAALKAGATANLKLKDLVEQDVFQKQFPAIKRQISNLQSAFSAAEIEFTKDARRLLPELRDGTTDEKEKITELQAAVALFQQRTKSAEDFITSKYTEASLLRETVAALLASGFEDHLGGFNKRSLIDIAAPRLLLSFGGPSIGCASHPLQRRIESMPSGPDIGSTSGMEDVDTVETDADENSDDEEEEWFNDQTTVAKVRQSCADLRQQRLLTVPGVTVTFGVANIDKAYGMGSKKKKPTTVGDIVLDNQGKLLIVTGMLPKSPLTPDLAIQGQTITVTWTKEREPAEETAIPTTGFDIKYCRRLNSIKDGAFPRASENELPFEVNCPPSAKQVVLGSLSDDCDYEVALSVRTIIGASPWSNPVVGRTDKLPSVASEMIEFFLGNKEKLTGDTSSHKPWDLYIPSSGNSKKTLFLGHKEIARRECKDQQFPGQVAVRIVDVAAEFKPEIQAPSLDDQERNLVVVFAGTSGHGKSTEINAFISYLLGGEVDDLARILAIDDRGANQAGSVTQIVTCFRVRPLSPLFEGKTLLIVDTPGYGDSRGITRDAFVTAAMSVFFETVGHVNAIIFTCRANEARTTLLSPVSTYIFSLFAKDVRSCLRTIYTFSDAGAPLARGALTQLGWPVENGEISVNNSAFTIDLDGNENDVVVREGWIQSVRGQFHVMRMLLRAPAVSTKNSALVTQNRIALEQKCKLAERKILKTANDANDLITHLNYLATAIGAAPGDTIEVVEDRAVQQPIPDGKATTLCLDCNFTCHEICAFGDDRDKVRCISMSNGKCTVCRGHCQWDRHRNARYKIVTEKHSTLMVPQDLIKRWNANNNTLEGALLTTMDTYVRFQEGLRNDILELAKLSEELTSTALLHDPTNLIKYVDTLIQTAKQLGAPPAQLMQLATARNTLILVREVKGKGVGVTRDSKILLDVIGGVREEMGRRMKLSPNERAKEEEKSCNL